MALADIETQVKAKAEARQLLTDRVAALKEGLDALHKDHMPGIKRALNRVAEIDAKAKALIADNPECFVRPKTLVMHGFKVGFAKGRGKIKFDKPALVIKRIKAQMPDQASLLIHSKEEPNKEALGKLPVADLRKLGCTISEAGDEPIVQPVDQAVDKLVAALLKGAIDEAEGAATADDA